MLVMNDVFARTWGASVGAPPSTEYWPPIISTVKAERPDFRFIAEAYWDREWDLQQQGFDYCYDKRLYDRLRHGSAEAVRQHLRAGLDYQARLVRFIENHPGYLGCCLYAFNFFCGIHMNALLVFFIQNFRVRKT